MSFEEEVIIILFRKHCVEEMSKDLQLFVNIAATYLIRSIRRQEEYSITVKLRQNSENVSEEYLTDD